MRFVSIDGAVMRSEAVMMSTTADVGTWLRVMSYAASIECGGRLVGAARWNSRRWLGLCNVTLKDVQRAGELLIVDDDDIMVYGYSLEWETTVRQRSAAGKVTSAAKAAAVRANGKLGGRPRSGQKPNEEPSEEPNGGDEANQTGNQAETKRKPNTKPKNSNSNSNSKNIPPSPPEYSRAGAQDGGDGGAVAVINPGKIAGIDEELVGPAVRSRNWRALLRAFGVICGPDLVAEWGAALDGTPLVMVATVLGWCRQKRTPIRLPSGWRAARVRFELLPQSDQMDLIRMQCAAYGLPVPNAVAARSAEQVAV